MMMMSVQSAETRAGGDRDKKEVMTRVRIYYASCINF